jgi:hypothetical protein
LKTERFQQNTARFIPLLYQLIAPFKGTDYRQEGCGVNRLINRMGSTHIIYASDGDPLKNIKNLSGHLASLLGHLRVVALDVPRLKGLDPLNVLGKGNNGEPFL